MVRMKHKLKSGDSKGGEINVGIDNFGAKNLAIEIERTDQIADD